jgi:tetratricopeptide (TPR) repeat protein
MEFPMLRWVVFIIIIELFSQSCLAIHPVFSKPSQAAPTRAYIEVSMFKTQLLTEWIENHQQGKKSLASGMRSLKEVAKRWFENVKKSGEWVIGNFDLVIIVILLVFIVLIGFFVWTLERAIRKVKGIGQEIIEFRDEAEVSMKSIKALVDHASAITHELSQLKSEKDQSVRAIKEKESAVAYALVELEQHLAKAEENLRHGESEAAAAISKTRDQAVKSIRSLLEGLKEFEQEKLEDTLQAWAQTLATNDKSPIAWENIGVAFGRQGCFHEALLAYEKAIELDPQHSSAWAHKGWALVWLGRPEKGLEALTEALKLDTNRGFSWYNKARAHSLLRQKSEMLNALKKAIELCPQYNNYAMLDPMFELFREDPTFQTIVF